jgi:hypothetical protein
LNLAGTTIEIKVDCQTWSCSPDKMRSGSASKLARRS